MESVIARVLKDPKQSIKGMRLLRFARNDRGRSVKRGYAKLSNRKVRYGYHSI